MKKIYAINIQAAEAALPASAKTAQTMGNALFVMICTMCWKSCGMPMLSYSVRQFIIEPSQDSFMRSMSGFSSRICSTSTVIRILSKRRFPQPAFTR